MHRVIRNLGAPTKKKQLLFSAAALQVAASNLPQPSVSTTCHIYCSVPSYARVGKHFSKLDGDAIFSPQASYFIQQGKVGPIPRHSWRVVPPTMELEKM